MIGLLSYLWISMWDVEVNKNLYANLSTAEIALEFYIIIWYFLIIRRRK